MFKDKKMCEILHYDATPSALPPIVLYENFEDFKADLAKGTMRELPTEHPADSADETTANPSDVSE